MNIIVSGTDSSFNDETIVRLLPGATNLYDSDYDAYKLMSDAGYASFYSQLGGTKYSVNTLADTASSITIPLLLGTPAGAYNFTFANAATFQNYDVVLTDNLLHQSQDVKQNPAYAFTLNGTDTVSRFFLNLRLSTTANTGVTSLISPNSGASYVSITNDTKNAYIAFINSKALQADIYLYDLLGRIVWQQNNANIASGRYIINGQVYTSGVYVVKVIVNGQITSQKVVFQE